MSRLRTITVTGLVLISQTARAEVNFSAQVDRAQAGLDESVSLKMTLKSDGGVSGGQVVFRAPFFDVVNEYSSTYVESYYDNGRFGVRNNQEITKVLRPTKTGTLRITGIAAIAGGKRYPAPDIVVQVVPGGQGTPPPRNYGGGGLGLRGSGKRVSAAAVLVRAEISKDKAFKGEQVVVSYYLYRRVRVLNIQVEKYPTLSGFLREDLEMPIVGQRLNAEQVILDGVPYERSLLVRYAAYPLQEGKLRIDPIALKYNYIGGANSFFDEEDLFRNFFRQPSLPVNSSKSEPLTIDVSPLPAEGRPAAFSGGVGDFNVTSAMDKYELRANEAVTLTVKVEGRGNAAAIGEPKATWPENVELYDSKGIAKSGRAGVGEKTFEYILIPRTAGSITLPKLEFAFFDPQKKTYVNRATEPIEINVLQPAAGAPLASRGRPQSKIKTANENAASSSDKQAVPLTHLKPGDGKSGGYLGQPIWRWAYWISSLTLLLFAGLVITDMVRKSAAGLKSSAQNRLLMRSKSWDKLRANAKTASNGASWQHVSETYELLCGAIFDAIDRAYGVGARSLPRSELKHVLVNERGLPEQAWEKMGQILEFAEMVRFASSAGAVSEEAARSELPKLVNESEVAVKMLEKKSSGKNPSKKL